MIIALTGNFVLMSQLVCVCAAAIWWRWRGRAFPRSHWSICLLYEVHVQRSCSHMQGGKLLSWFNRIVQVSLVW